jgi:DNA-binding CsgD family transcriptional regulator
MWRLVGREQEAARLGTFLAGVADGPSALVIEGEPGIGKTALFEATLARATGVSVLRARCAEPEAGLAYAGLGDLLGGVTEPVLAGLPRPQRRAVEVVLGRVEVGRDPVEPQMVGRATLAVLETLAASAPVLVAVDDVQWLDAASARALTFAVRRLGSLVPVGVLVTKRGVNGPLPLGLDEALPPERRERLLVGPLDPRDLELLVEERLASPLSRALRRRVAAVAGGNPLYALELAAAQRLAGRSQDDLLGLPAQLEELLADRLGRLPTEAIEPLAAVASLANPTVALINGVLGAPAGAGLDAALDAGVLLVGEGRLRFSHPLVAVAASARLAPSARRKLHARLAATLTDPEERARHLVLAADGPDVAVAAAVEQGAERARARGAPEVAAELAEAAVRLTPAEQVEDLRRRRIAAGYHRVAAGEISRGQAHLAAALEEAPPGPVQTDLRWRLGMLLLSDGDLGRAVELLETALAESRGDQALHAIVARRLAGVYYWHGRFGEAVRLMRLAVELAQALGDPRAQLDALTMGVFAFLMAGELPEDLPARLEQLAGTSGPLQPHEDPQLGLAMVDLASGDAASAARRMQEVYRRAVDEGDELALALVPAQLAQVELVRGRWQRAQGWAEEALRTTKRLARPFALAQGLLAAATVDAHLGKPETVRAAAAELVDQAERTGLVPFVLEGRAVLGFVALSQGDARAAHAELGPVLERLSDLGVREPIVVRLVWTELDALIELGELDQAAALASELEARGRALDRPFALVTAARAHGRIHAARGDLDAALARLEQALGEHDRLGWPFERARTQLVLGMVLRRGKHKRAARQTLEEAATVFDQLGSRLWSAKTEAELARIGGRPPRTGELTPTERRVAELVTQGHTNREVADLLFLSVKTVAAHLTSAYAKLGVRSRTELAHRLHASATDDATLR